ncbi:MAG: hypothetical protein EOO36_15690, partial [Cytophagaceae bacterium]
MNILTKSLVGLLGVLALAGCKKELDTYYAPQPAGGYSVLVTNAALATKYAPGETIPVGIGYNAGDAPNSITVFQATRTDSAQVSSTPIDSSLPISSTTGLTVQGVRYVVPTSYPVGTVVRVDITLNFGNGGSRLRRFTYQVANTPTLALGTPVATYRNGLSATAQSEGDLIGYALV